jgi:hypothetical protein
MAKQKKSRKVTTVKHRGLGVPLLLKNGGLEHKIYSCIITFNDTHNHSLEKNRHVKLFTFIASIASSPHPHCIDTKKEENDSSVFFTELSQSGYP